MIQLTQLQQLHREKCYLNDVTLCEQNFNLDLCTVIQKL